MQVLYHSSRFSPLNMRVNLWDTDGTFYSADFTGVYIRHQSTSYLLEVTQHIDGLGGLDGGLTTYQSQVKFSTFDNLPEEDANRNCAVQHGTGWWFLYSDQCFTSLLTGTPNKDVTQPGALTWSGISKPVAKAKVYARPLFMNESK